MALGGSVEVLDEPELGWHTIETDAPELVAAGPWLQWHFEAFTTPPGAEELARSPACAQAFRLGPHLAVQFHPESTAEIVVGVGAPRRAAAATGRWTTTCGASRRPAGAAGPTPSARRCGCSTASGTGAGRPDDSPRRGYVIHSWQGRRNAATVRGRGRRSRLEKGRGVLENQAVKGSEIVPATASTVRVLFSDLHGVARGKDVPVGEFDRVVDHGICFCSAVMGTDLRHTPVVGGEEGYPDMRAVPDLTTLLPVPWEPGVSTVIADLERVGDERPEPTDPRGAVRRAVSEFEALGYAPIIGPELEFYLCRSDGGNPPRITRYMDRLSMVYTVGPQADPNGLVRKLTENLSELGLETFAVNHEFSNSQYEINLREAPALQAADRGFLLRSAVKDVAAQHGLVATFMGKPFNDQGGSGFHVHISLEPRRDQRLRGSERPRRDQRADARVHWPACCCTRPR